jgi:hypothetical protein
MQETLIFVFILVFIVLNTSKPSTPIESSNRFFPRKLETLILIWLVVPEPKSDIYAIFTQMSRNLEEKKLLIPRVGTNNYFEFWHNINLKTDQEKLKKALNKYMESLKPRQALILKSYYQICDSVLLNRVAPQGVNDEMRMIDIACN